MEEKILKIEKIVVNTEDELTDIVRDVHKSEAERIILTFTEQSDLLISPINLKVIKETAQKEGKLLIAQIIQNPTGTRNCHLAGIKVIETPTKPTEEDWEEAQELSAPKPKKIEEKPVPQPPVNTRNSFEERVNNAISKSRVEQSDPKPEKPVNDEDILNIDSDIPEDQNRIEDKKDLTDKDFAVTEDVKTPMKPILPEIKNSIENLKNIPVPKINIDKKKTLNLVLKLIIPLLALVIIAAFAYYKLFPFVKVRIFVEAKPVSIGKTFTGDPNIQSIDFDNLKIPIKTDEESKDLSDSLTATGQAFKGDKATGTVRLVYTLGRDCTDADPQINLPNGQTVSTSDYSFKLVGTAVLTCGSITDVQVQAADIGEEYNIPSGKYFTVQGYPQNQIYGNNSAAFTGGSKTSYTVLSQQDVDKAVENLSTTAIEEVKSDLRSKDVGWDIIEDTIKSEVDKSSIKTDVPVGSEASTVNIQLTIKGTATYYLTDGLNEGLTGLLRTEAQNQNLFESDNNLDLVLGDNINKNLSVVSAKGDTVEIKLTADATVKPNVDKTEIQKNLSGMKWNEGLNYLSTLNFAAQQTEVDFNPKFIPEFLRYFPKRQGGVLISIIELQNQE